MRAAQQQLHLQLQRSLPPPAVSNKARDWARRVITRAAGTCAMRWSSSAVSAATSAMHENHMIANNNSHRPPLPSLPQSQPESSFRSPDPQSCPLTCVAVLFGQSLKFNCLSQLRGGGGPRAEDHGAPPDGRCDTLAHLLLQLLMLLQQRAGASKRAEGSGG